MTHQQQIGVNGRETTSVDHRVVRLEGRGGVSGDEMSRDMAEGVMSNGHGGELREQLLIRVLIVEDHEILANGLARLLESCSDFEVVGVSRTAADAVSTAIELTPDVVLMDYQLPDGDGVLAMEQIKREVPATHVVMLTSSDNDERLARRAFEAGCSGFVGKSRSVEDLFSVVRAAHSGDVLITPVMLLMLLPRSDTDHGAVGANLSRRELEVLGVMAEGGSDKEIADTLFISLNTARKHAQNIIRKLGAHSKLEAVVIAVRAGVIHPM
jgi:DNA-binding NarL/FixJ family response regulator